MDVMLKLKLPPELQNLQAVRKLNGLNDLSIDERFGLVCVDPKQELFVVRVHEIDRVDERKKHCPELVDTYGDQRIEGIVNGNNREEVHDG